MASRPITAVPAGFTPLTGHCNCKALSYTVKAPPMITHCCHCTYCQRGSGSVFGVNCFIESYNFSLTPSSPSKQPKLTDTPSESGNGETFASCPDCGVTLYTFYGGDTTLLHVQVGSLDQESRVKVRPDVHIYTSTKLPWVDLSAEAEKGIPIFEEYYEKKDVWSESSMVRREALLEWQSRQNKV